MPRVEREARVRYSAEQMFDLVNDVEKYPEFLHWCRGARIESRQSSTVEASLDIGVAGFERSLRTRNTLQRPELIAIELVSGPFQRLRGEWRFKALDDGGAHVSLSLVFDASTSLFGSLFSRVFEEIAASQMTAFIARAQAVYP